MTTNNDMPREPSPSHCSLCGAEKEWVACWQCHGEGGWHDCGEDCCPCLDKDEITEWCDECDGKGRYLQCPNVPHPEHFPVHCDPAEEPQP